MVAHGPRHDRRDPHGGRDTGRGAPGRLIRLGGLTGASPFDLPPLGGRFAGSWIALLAVLAGWAALRNRRDDATHSLAALVALPAGMLVAALRTLPDLEPGGAAIAYVAAIGLLLAVGAVLAAGPARSWTIRPAV